MKVAVQCLDVNSGEIGSFLHFGDFRAVTQVYKDCESLFDACERNGMEEYVEKDEPKGDYK